MNEYEEEWASDSDAGKPTPASMSAAGKKAEGDEPDFNYDSPVMVADAAMERPSVEATPEAAEPAKALSFKETFAAQRKAGAQTFEWNGKRYTTALKGPAATSKPGAASAMVKYAPAAPMINTSPPAEKKPFVRGAGTRMTETKAPVLVKPLSVPAQEAPVMFNTPGAKPLRFGQSPAAPADVPAASEAQSPRRGYKSNA